MRPRPGQLVSLLRPKRRWAQFSLGTMLLAVTVLCVWLADYVSPVRRLERQLRDPNENRRELAAERLGYLGPEARSATNSLLRATDDTSSSFRMKAAWALSRVSGRPDLLAQLLTHSDDGVRLAAAEGLLWMGEDLAELMPTLLDLVRRTRQAGSIFEALGPDQAAAVVPLLLDSLSAAADAEWFDPAAIALSEVATPAATVVPALIDRLRDSRPSVRMGAAEQLLRLRQRAKQAAPALRARLDDREPRCACACAAALGAVDPDDTEFIPVLKAALRSDDSKLRQRVARYLLMLGPAAAAASDDLIAFLCEDPGDGWLPDYDPGALDRIGPPAVWALDRALRHALARRDRLPATPEEFTERLAAIGLTARPVLEHALDHAWGETDATDDALGSSMRMAEVRILEWALERATVLAAPERRQMIPYWLGMLGPPARPAVPTLITALDYADLQCASVEALGMIGKDSESAVPYLLRFLSSEDEILRHAVLDALQGIGVSYEAARARLRPFLKSSDREERARAALVLARSGEAPEKMLPILIELGTDPYFGLRRFGMRDDFATSLAQLGPAATPGLTSALESHDEWVRALATEALIKAGPVANAAIPRLIAMLDDGASWGAAAKVLGSMGPESRAAVPKLIEMLEALRAPLDLSDFGPAETDPNEPSEDESNELPRSGPNGSSDDDIRADPNANEYVTILMALRGIGADARDAAPAVVKLANSDDPEVRHVAIQTLARIDPANPSLMRYLGRWLAEWERKSATDHTLIDFDWSFDEFSDAVWQLGPRAEPLVPELSRLMATAPLMNPRVRCYAAYSLARFPSHRQAAVGYLNAIRRTGFSDIFNLINPADELLQRIAGAP